MIQKAKLKRIHLRSIKMLDKTDKDKKIKKEKNLDNLPMIAIIRVRGVVGVDGKITDTLNMLKLHRKNFCVIYRTTPSISGMVQKIKDFVTWGEIDEATLKELIDKRGKQNPNDKTRTKPFFRLNPPVKGFGRKGIKKPFSVGGALGYRGAKINDLIKRMV